MKGQENAVNTFKDGLLMDTNPLSNDGTSLTNALNATLTTHNGNELMLQNDMGNGRINKVRLDEGYIPVGIKEHGGIIYIASYNPETKKGQIGSFPYPKVEYDNTDCIDDDPGYNTPLDYIYDKDEAPIKSKSICTDDIIYFNKIIHNSLKVKLFTMTNEDNELVQVKFRLGDSFSLTFDSETSKYLMSENIEASIVSKTSSDYITLYTISKEELSENGTTISSTYNYPYSGTLFLQVSLNIPDMFDINYELNGSSFIVYPHAYNSEDPENIYTNKAVAVLRDNKLSKTNFDCGSSITLDSGIYDIGPVTLDKGYLKYLELKVILNANSKNNIFKYKFNDGSLDLYWDIFMNNSHYNEGTTYRFTYTFYPLDSAGNVTSLQALLQLPYTVQVSKEGYPVISGLRNLKCTLPSDSIYVLLITVAAKSLGTYSNELPCFGGFIYGTSRYNDKFDEVDNFNNITRETQEVEYTFNRQLLELNRTSIINKHLIQNEWQEMQGVVLFSDDLIDNTKIPEAYSSEIAVKMTKTEEPVVVAPKQDVRFIYDSDLFSVETSKFNIDLSDAYISDIPEKNKSTRVITALKSEDLSNIYRLAIQDLTSITFYRYISSESSDGLVQLTRTFKQLMPIFNPNMLNYEELFGFDFTGITTITDSSNNKVDICSVTGVGGSRDFLNMTSVMSLSVNDVTGDDDDVEDKTGWGNKITGENLGNASPNVIKLFLLTHSKDNRGQDVSSIFDLFIGAVSTDGEHLDNASLRINDSSYIPYKVFGGLDRDCAWNEFADDANYIIPSCLTYTNQPLLLPLPSSTIGVCYTKDYSMLYSDRTKYPKNEITSAKLLNINSNTDRKKDLMIPAFKKLFCLLSQIFTLQEQESYIYIVGPSEITVNYNIQDDSYVKYDTQADDIFIDTTILENLNSIENYLSGLTVSPNNYIGRLKLTESLDNYFFYGRDVNMDSPLYNNILSQYINAYDESIVIDNSSGYSVNDIYYLDFEKIYSKYLNNLNPMYDFNYTPEHNRIASKANYPMDDENGKLVIDGNYNKLWPDYDIYYNPTYNCYQYDLSKSNFLSLLTKSTINSKNLILDWAGNCWNIPSLISSFMTVEEAKDTVGSLIGTYSNNFIVLRNLNTVSSSWVEGGGSDPSGPLFAKISLGFRGHRSRYLRSNNIDNFTGFITNKILNIINLYNHNYVATSGRYITPTTPADTVTP